MECWMVVIRKLTFAQAEEIRARTDLTNGQLALKYKVHPTTIQMIRVYETYKRDVPYRVVLSREAVEDIRTSRAAGVKGAVLALKYGVSQARICQVYRGRRGRGPEPASYNQPSNQLSNPPAPLR
jgi:hypothetical protein